MARLTHSGNCALLHILQEVQITSHRIGDKESFPFLHVGGHESMGLQVRVFFEETINTSRHHVIQPIGDLLLNNVLPPEDLGPKPCQHFVRALGLAKMGVAYVLVLQPHQFVHTV